MLHTASRRIAATAAAALASLNAAAFEFEGQTDLARFAREMVSDSLGFAAEQLVPERVVKGAPYCADAVQETIQWLPDGSGSVTNRIVRRQTTRLCRDGDGRTRQEVERDGRKRVYLRDPVARQSWVLDPERKTARPLRGAGAGDDHGEWREYAERMREWARSFADQMRSEMRSFPRPGASAPAQPAAPPAPPAPGAMPHPPQPPHPPRPAIVLSTAGDAGPRVLRIDAGGEPVPPELRWRAAQFAPRGQGVSSPLGGKDFDGVRADGVRTAWTIEAGKIGNEKPIVITRDVWTSPELMLTVHWRDVDPRSGEQTYTLRNLKRGEPDPQLMRVPDEFSSKPRATR
jgi:hypothetical protein